jgi:hypothetical protein
MTEREEFEAWYATHAFDYERNQIGIRECSLQWAVWHAQGGPAMTIALPPMPPGQMQGAGIDNGIVTWREDQLRAYGIAAQRLALDVAARVCESRVIGDHNREDAEAARCAKAIRALMP